MKKKRMYYLCSSMIRAVQLFKFKHLALLLFLISFINVFGFVSKPLELDKSVFVGLELQNVVTGIITSESGEPLSGANVTIKGANAGVVADLDGKYELQLTSSENIVLVFSYLGYLTKEIPYQGQTVLNVSLAEDVNALDEIVVVGYGGVKKSDLTGSVSQVKSEEIMAYPTSGITQALQGRAAGVQVSSNNGGEPGANLKIRIRGGTSVNSSSDPLYVIDGFPGGIIPPPEDIASIEILKDASATSIYGSRGSNGVVLITTKKGKSGKTTIEINSSYSIQSAINRFDLLNATELAEYVNETSLNNGGAIRYDNPSSFGVGTDWQDLIFRNGAIKNNQVSVSGGGEKVNYYISGSLFNQDGVVINSDFQRYSATGNIDVKASEKLKIGANLLVQRSESNGVRTQEANGGVTPGVIGAAYRFEPMLGVRDDDGVYTLAQLNAPFDNPVAVATELVDETVLDRYQVNFYGEYLIFKNLTFKSTFGANTVNRFIGGYVPSVLSSARGVRGSASIATRKSTNLIAENYLTYTKNINAHDISVLAGYSYQSSKNASVLARANGFITDAGSYWSLSQGSELQPASSFYNKSEISSVYGRLNYKFNDKYLLTLNARYDGASSFAANNKWGFFPSGALAWNVSKEDFLKNNETLNDLKLRLSYGVTGNQAIDPYESLARFSSVLAIVDGEIVNAVRPTAVANRNLTWESTAQTNFGIDAAFLNNRIALTVDYYNMKTSDLLFSKPLPQYSGYSFTLDNIGAVENKGFEFALATKNLNGKLKWDTNFNISFNKNKVLELPDGEDILYSAGPAHMVGLGNTAVLREGAPVGSFYGYVYEGVLQSDTEALPGNFETEAGGEKFKDVNGDGEITADDRVVIGNPHPDFTWGLNNTLSYGNFDLNLFIQGSHGNDIYSFSLMELDLMSGLNNATTNALNRWTPTNTNTDVPIARNRSRVSSSRFVYDGSYMRLKNISLGYNLPANIVGKLSINSVRLSVSAQNILTVTKYPGLDPEVNYRSSGSVNSNRNLGLDYGSYPNTKSVTFGLNIRF